MASYREEYFSKVDDLFGKLRDDPFRRLVTPIEYEIERPGSIQPVGWVRNADADGKPSIEINTDGLTVRGTTPISFGAYGASLDLILTRGTADFGDGNTTQVALRVSGGIVDVAGETWHAPTMENSWVHFGGSWPTPKYRKDANGYVHLSGLIKGGTVGSRAFTLPGGYRPHGGASTNLHFAVPSNDSFGIVKIHPEGYVTPASPSSNVWVDLAGIVFRAEQ